MAGTCPSASIYSINLTDKCKKSELCRHAVCGEMHFEAAQLAQLAQCSGPNIEGQVSSIGKDRLDGGSFEMTYAATVAERSKSK
jgi:hypothetical protein